MSEKTREVPQFADATSLFMSSFDNQERCNDDWPYEKIYVFL